MYGQLPTPNTKKRRRKTLDSFICAYCPSMYRYFHDIDKNLSTEHKINEREQNTYVHTSAQTNYYPQRMDTRGREPRPSKYIKVIQTLYSSAETGVLTSECATLTTFLLQPWQDKATTVLLQDLSPTIFEVRDAKKCSSCRAVEFFYLLLSKSV